MEHVTPPHPASVVWAPASRAAEYPYPGLTVLAAMRRGAAGRCPACGNAPLFATWLRQAPVCAACAAPLGQISADDAPPYFTIFIVAHAVIALQIALERCAPLSVAAELAIFLPLTLALTLALIRPVKGATIGLMLKLGFGAAEETGQPPHA